MNSQLQHLFDLLEAERHELSEKLSALSLQQLNYARPGKWSIKQIVAHLVTSEKISVQYMNKKILGIGDADETGVKEEIKMVLLKISQRLPFRFNAPRVVVENTPAYSDFRDLASDWDLTRTALRILLEKFGDDQLKKKIYRHVRAGLLNVRQALVFSREHILHHKPQIKRLL